MGRQEQTNHLFSNRDLRILLVPLIVEQILNSLMGTADSIMVSNVGSAAISAVSLVDSINILVIQAFYALAAGGTIVCSQYIGQKDKKNAERYLEAFLKTRPKDTKEEAEMNERGELVLGKSNYYNAAAKWLKDIQSKQKIEDFFQNSSPQLPLPKKDK